MFSSYQVKAWCNEGPSQILYQICDMTLIKYFYTIYLCWNMCIFQVCQGFFLSVNVHSELLGILYLDILNAFAQFIYVGIYAYFRFTKGFCYLQMCILNCLVSCPWICLPSKFIFKQFILKYESLVMFKISLTNILVIQNTTYRRNINDQRPKVSEILDLQCRFSRSSFYYDPHID